MLKEIERVVLEADNTFNKKVRDAEKLVVEPVRRSAAHRFPTLFLLLTTFGAAAVFYSIEGFFEMWSLTTNRPWLILLIGVSILVFTGTLHKKLK